VIARAVVALDQAQRPSGVPGPTERVDAAGDGDEQLGQLALPTPARGAAIVIACSST